MGVQLLRDGFLIFKRSPNVPCGGCVLAPPCSELGAEQRRDERRATSVCVGSAALRDPWREFVLGYLAEAIPPISRVATIDLPNIRL